MKFHLALGALCAAIMLAGCGGGERVGNSSAPDADEESDGLSQPDDPLEEDSDDESSMD